MPTTIKHFDPALPIPVLADWGVMVVQHLLRVATKEVWQSNDCVQYLETDSWHIDKYSEVDPVDDDYISFQEETNRREMHHMNGAYLGRVILVTNAKDTKLLGIEIPDSDDPIFDTLARGKGAMPHADFGSW